MKRKKQPTRRERIQAMRREIDVLKYCIIFSACNLASGQADAEQVKKYAREYQAAAMAEEQFRMGKRRAIQSAREGR